jgi:predicted transcriptional regulator
MMVPQIEELFYELASESRHSILLELKVKNWKMNELARKLDLTTTETFRQLQRLSDAGLATKQPEGTYAITEYGQLVLELSSPLEFLLKNKTYFQTHDARVLPHSFLMRLDELAGAKLILGMVESTTKISQMIGAAKRYMWAISPEPFVQTLPDIGKQVPAGAEFRTLSPQPAQKLPSLENRALTDPPVVMVVTETQAAVCFRLVGGKVDYASFFGADSAFHRWARDLFLFYWEKATHNIS